MNERQPGVGRDTSRVANTVTARASSSLVTPTHVIRTTVSASARGEGEFVGDVFSS